jgi:DNA-binding transcriptional LysR family regulator
VTLEDVRVFVAVYELESLSAVARRLGRTQPAVRHHVARLERELRVPLLERRPKGVTPTAAGRVLYEALRAGLSAIQGGIRDVERFRDGDAGELRITTGGTTVRHLLREAVVQFRRRFPDALLRFEPTNSTRQCLETLLRDEADLAFVSIGGEARALEQRVAVEVPFVLVTPTGDTRARRKRVEIGDLQGLRYISLPARTATYALIDRVFAEHGIRLETTATVDDFDTAILFVELGLGHAIVPAIHARQIRGSAQARAVPIAGFPAASLGWAARHWAALSPLALEFVRIFHDRARRWRDIPGLRVAPPQ